MLCANCGKITSSDEMCEFCHAPMPERGTTPPYMNDPLLEISELLYKWDCGLLDEWVFEERLNSKREDYESILHDVASVNMDPDVKEEMSEEVRIGTMGVNSLIHALELVKEYAQSGDPVHKEQALAAAESGTKMLNKALRLNWESFNILQATTEEMLALAQNTI